MPVNSTWAPVQHPFHAAFHWHLQTQYKFWRKTYWSQRDFSWWHVGSGPGSAYPPLDQSNNAQLFPAWPSNAWSWDPAGSLVLMHGARRCIADSSLLQPTLSKKTTHPLTDQNKQVFAQQNHRLHAPLHTPHSRELTYLQKTGKVLPPSSSSSSAIPISHFSSRCFVKPVRKVYNSLNCSY